MRKLLIASGASLLMLAIIAEVYYWQPQPPISPLPTTIEYPASDSSQHSSICITACTARGRDKIFPVFISVTNESDLPLTVRSDQVFALPAKPNSRMLAIPPQEAARMAAAGWSGVGYALTTISAFGTVLGGLLGAIIATLVAIIIPGPSKEGGTRRTFPDRIVGTLRDNSDFITKSAALLGAIGVIVGLIYSSVRIYRLEESDEAGQANQEFTFLALREESKLPKGFTVKGYVYFLDRTKKGIKSLELLLATEATVNVFTVGGGAGARQDGPAYKCQVDGPHVYKCQVDYVQDCSDTQPVSGRCLSPGAS
jgi:hypothetical protein